MRAVPKMPECEVAVHAQNAKAFGELVAFKPPVQYETSSTTSYFFTVLFTITFDVIDGQKLRVRFSTTRAAIPAVGSVDLIFCFLRDYTNSSVLRQSFAVRPSGVTRVRFSDADPATLLLSRGTSRAARIAKSFLDLTISPCLRAR